jgi:hypothetical protein
MSETADDHKLPRAHVGLGVLSMLFVGLSVLSMLFASVVAVATFLSLSSPGGIACGVDKLVRGANINHGLGIVALGGLADSALIVCVRRWRRLLAAALLLGAATLGIAIAFVAVDSATQIDTESCASLLGVTPETRAVHHVYELYALWGLPLGLLLLAAGAPWVPLRLRLRLSNAHE